MPQPSPILVLGMHRSGTSCLTGCLEEAGLYLGNVNTKAGFNAKGNRENRDVMELHDRVLARVGATWDNPPDVDPDWTSEELDILGDLIGRYPDDQTWGTKDPRVLFMMKGWRRCTSPKFVGTFRHPSEVAASLVHRAQAWQQSMPLDKAFTIWGAYNAALLRLHTQDPFDVIRFDIDPTLYNQKLVGICEKLDLKMPKNAKFRDAALHNQHTREDVPEHLAEIWEALNAISV